MVRSKELLHQYNPSYSLPVQHQSVVGGYANPVVNLTELLFSYFYNYLYFYFILFLFFWKRQEVPKLN